MSSSCCAKNPLPAVNMNKRSCWLGCSWAQFWDYLVLVLTTTQVTKHIELHTSFSGLTPTMYEYQDWATYCRSYDESENSTSRTRRPEKVDWNAHESWTCSYLPYIPWFSALCTKVWSRNTRTVWTWREEKGMANPSGWSWPIEFPWVSYLYAVHCCWKSFETSVSTSWRQCEFRVLSTKLKQP